MIIDGKAIAAQVKARVAVDVTTARAAGARVPALATVLVGDDAASAVYIKNKRASAAACGIDSRHHALPSSTTTAELLALVTSLNDDSAVDGILVQLPLPAHVDESAVLVAIAPHKDVDGFHPDNVARLVLGLPGFVPCTPLGSLALIRSTGVLLPGLHCVVVGRSNIVGKPMAQLLLREHATVTICHSKTRDLAALCRQADVVVAAVGRAHMLGAAHIKPGAIVIDVGINRTTAGTLVGDVDFDAVKNIAARITPVPGGVGPMTIAMLMHNTFTAFQNTLQEHTSKT
jgi:methylenetetrahydrofolate dehydrogenase (NADP+) / methenyltetrahydrofolate cyclohydrolase